MTQLHDRIATVLERIRLRSHDRRQAYLDDIAAMEESPDSDRASSHYNFSISLPSLPPVKSKL